MARAPSSLSAQRPETTTIRTLAIAAPKKPTAQAPLRLIGEDHQLPPVSSI
jgi:hypothetical protein